MLRCVVMACIAVQLHPTKLSTVAPDLHSEQKFRIYNSPCFTMVHHGSPCFTMVHHVSPCFIMFHHVLSCFTMFHHVSPCFIMFYRHFIVIFSSFHRHFMVALSLRQSSASLLLLGGLISALAAAPPPTAPSDASDAASEPTSRDFESNSQSRWRWKSAKVAERWLKGGWNWRWRRCLASFAELQLGVKAKTHKFISRDLPQSLLRLANDKKDLQASHNNTQSDPIGIV